MGELPAEPGQHGGEELGGPAHTDAQAEAAYEGKLAFSNALQSLMRYSQEFGSTPEVEKEIAFLGSRIQ